MSNSSRRKINFDYSILHKTEKRVQKVWAPRMANQELQLKAINISSDIEDLFESYQNLNDDDRLTEFLTKIGDIKRDFRRIHAQ